MDRLATLARRLRGAAARAARIARFVMGAPDYERYVAHVRRRHPGQAPLSRDDFVRERLDARYARPGSRCC